MDLGEFLAGEHPDYKIKFVHAQVGNFIQKIKNDEYDLVLGLSVFHWVVKQSGFQYTQELFSNLAEKITVGLFEFSLAQEFPDINLPKNYREFLKDYFFVRVLKYYTWNEKRKFQRPLCFASEKYAHFDDWGILKIDQTSSKDRKHFICDDKFVKIVDMRLDMVQNEIQFLKDLGGQNGLPKLHTTSQETDETGTRTFIVIDKIKGFTLSKMISKIPDLGEWNVIEQLLRWMIFFEKHGYYQMDLTPTNFIYNEVGKIIPIDFGLVIRKPISIRWPFNIRLNFIGFMNVFFIRQDGQNSLFFKNKVNDYSTRQLLTTFGQYVSDDKYRRILALHDDEKFFENLYEILFSPSDSLSKTPHHSPTIAEIENLEKEEGMRDLWLIAKEQQASIRSLTQTIKQQQKRIEKLEKIINEKLK